MQGNHHVLANGTDTTTQRKNRRTGRRSSVRLGLWRPGSIFRRVVTVVGAAALATGTAVAVPVVAAGPAQAATTNTVGLSVTSARTEPHAPNGAVAKGDPVTHYRYMINVDNTGTSDPVGGPEPGSGCSAEDPGYPSECTWASMQEVTGAPIYRQGTQTDFANGATLTLPDGRYLITVLADDYKIDGAHFSMPMEEPGVLNVTVQPHPLPDSTLRAIVFQDEASTNGAIDNGENGLEGFQGHINDTLGEVTTDVYGNPLCTTYVNEDANFQIPWDAASRDADGNPIVETIGGKCLSDADGMINIPHLGTNRYTTTVIPPDGSDWIQTTTLEGNHDWDTWLLEGSTGYDTEFALAGEPVPTPEFGFVHPHSDITDTTPTGSIHGTVVAVKQYYPPVGGSFTQYWGSVGSKLDKPIPNAVLSLSDLGNGDQSVWAGRAGTDGSFTIPHVPDGNYTLTWWDEPQNYILQLVQVTVSGGEAVDLKQLPMNGWWTPMTGHVFLDANKNGKRDPGEQGVSQFPLTLRKKDNSLMDRGTNAVATDSTGYYEFPATYPLAEWLIMEAYSDNFYTTGVTYQTDNQPTPTTIKGAGVDLSILPIIGLSGTVDWGVQKYDAAGANGGPRNGGIVGSISYDTTRNELDPTYAASEDWQPGISDIPVMLYGTVDCGTNAGVACDSTDTYELAPDGAIAKGKLLNAYLSEKWSRPTGCTARDVDGNPFAHGTDENILVTNQETDGECLSALIQGVQVGTYATDQGTVDANFGASVDGNYGFGDQCTGELDATDPSDPQCVGGTFEPLPAGDYLVSLEIPNDASGKPMYKATEEEDINVGRGDQVLPQVPPPACAGPLHTVDVKGLGTDDYPENPLGNGVTVPASTAVDNPTFLDMGGSPYEGTPKPGCETKLVGLNNGKSIVPMFNIFTDVPIPSRLRGIIVDDINFSTDNRTMLYGDKAGVANAPVGLYDFANDLKFTAHSDYNGYYDVLMPSSDHINCPTPSGVCTNMYRFVGNDPGVPGALNGDYNPRFRTIGTEFEAMPGVTIPTDLAPTQVGVSIGTPGSSPTTVKCLANPVRPQLFSVSQPYIRNNQGNRSVTIDGYGFGASKGTGTVKLGTTVLTTTSWSNTRIVATMPRAGSSTGQVAAGAYDLSITSENGLATDNALTFHLLGTGYLPNVYEVGPGVGTAKYDPTKTASETGTAGVRHAIQNAIDDALANTRPDLVVVYPNVATTANPRGAYYENLVVPGPLKLQGVGAGGFQGSEVNSPYIQGTVIDGGAFGGDTDLATDWFTKVDGLTWSGNQTVSDGAVIYLLGRAPGDGAANVDQYSLTSSFKPTIDGFDLRGGDQQGFPGNINTLTGHLTNLPPNIVTQGGAIFANAYVRQLQITNNVVQNNGGGYGTIRIGTPDLTGTDESQHNEKVRIANNRIIQNAGTNLAGAIGLFAGADTYEVAGNDICGNFSLEYGAGVSVYGLSPSGRIHDNRITLNNSNDEGAGIMIAGALPANPVDLSTGSGAVDIYANEIKGNLANDDGGGIRFLMAGNSPMNVFNNVIASNVSTHEGGGIGINDAPNVRIYNNTIMDNLTTATAVTSNGLPAPAGVSTSENSEQLQATLPGNAPSFSRPLLFNNVMWGNLAGSRAGTTVYGIGLHATGTDADADVWDVGVADGTGVLAPVNSVIGQDVAQHVYTADPTNSAADPKVVEPWQVSVSFATWRQNPAFVDANVVAVEVPADLMGDYHLTTCGTGGSSACDIGAASRGGVSAPLRDIDGDVRPNNGAWDAGADEALVVAPPPPVEFLFSTAGNGRPPGITRTVDNSDIYRYDGVTGTYSREIFAQGAAGGSIPALANVDGFAQVDSTHWYMSFSADTTLPDVGTIQDEDVVYWNGSTWSMYFDGTVHGLTTSLLDVNAIGIQNGTLYFSTVGSANPPGVTGPADNSDVYSWNGTSFARVWDATTVGVPGSARVDGAVRLAADHYYLSFSTDTTIPGLGAVQDEDIVEFYAGTWRVWFNGTAHGLTNNGHDIDAFSLPGGATAP